MEHPPIHSETRQEKAAEMLHDYLIPFLISGIIFFFLVGLVLSFLFNLFLSKTASQTPPSTSLPIKTTSPTPDPTANWKTYTNEKYNFSFKYPTDWFISGNEDYITLSDHILKPEAVNLGVILIQIEPIYIYT